MNFRESNQDIKEIKYISKRVMINGQFVTLYSANGQTWVSSPEDIPALMERLDNARVTLNTADKVAVGESAKVAPPEKAQKNEPQEAPERTLASKYRIKGPKPRPILRQDGVVIKGTPIEPISASATVMGFSSDVKIEIGGNSDSKGAKSAKSTKGRETKLIAPLVSKKVVKGAAKPPATVGKAAAKQAASKQAAAKQVALKPAEAKQASVPAAAKSRAVKGVRQLEKAAKTTKKTRSAKPSVSAKAKKPVASKSAKKLKVSPAKKHKATKKTARKGR